MPNFSCFAIKKIGKSGGITIKGNVGTHRVEQGIRADVVLPCPLVLQKEKLSFY